MLLAFERAITWRWQSLYEIGAPCEVKGGAVDTKFGNMTFDELRTVDNTLLTFIFFYILLSTLLNSQNTK